LFFYQVMLFPLIIRLLWSKIIPVGFYRHFFLFEPFNVSHLGSYSFLKPLSNFCFFSFKMFWSHSNQLFICSTLNFKNAKNRTNFKVWRPIRLNFVYLLLFFSFRIMRTIEIVNVTLIWLNVEFFYLYRSINLFFKCIKFFSWNQFSSISIFFLLFGGFSGSSNG